MAHQRARATAPVEADGRAAIWPNHVPIEIHQPLSGHTGRCRAHAVGSMANRATETVLRDVQAVLRETRVRDHFGQVVALRAHRIRATDGQVGIRK